MKEEIEKALEVLKKGGIILYPTDTVWGIGCDATNAEAVDRIYKLKKRSDSKAMICLVNSVKMLEQFINSVPEPAYDIIDHAQQPTTIIYDNPIKVANNLVGEDDTLAIRVVKEQFCENLIYKLRRPLVSTSANISGEPTPNSFAQIAPEILKGVDYVVNLHQSKTSGKPSAIIKIGNDRTVKVIRK
ncbi:threonylcarbamoyl-AMP synthase [Antarcticibacterium flavum]|uniref:L-threonylcarbamoyladenylate synthase n=1 Tax=Antarcticibacterium flavum TaxID=2058175 RepID=A0A5B7X5Z9_9FLAO|nr:MULTISPECIES: L-threonylcarbamoyladenylate synthase [Antarcticibacterium]MCM4159363.1 threonylcarbamoyl-AMP synthase [Antarcticibacterium sp. W02-3]QCY70934.1 threonylcarbamoyl-AMP synthase [Antarcticibacterium flavum]